jgi:hypothetical protein
MGMEQLAWSANRAPDLRWQALPSSSCRRAAATVSHRTKPFPSPSSSYGVLPISANTSWAMHAMSTCVTD